MESPPFDLRLVGKRRDRLESGNIHYLQRSAYFDQSSIFNRIYKNCNCTHLVTPIVKRLGLQYMWL